MARPEEADEQTKRVYLSLQDIGYDIGKIGSYYCLGKKFEQIDSVKYYQDVK